MDLKGPWEVSDLASQTVEAPCPGDWAHSPGLETFSGTLCYRTRFELPRFPDNGPIFLDLGRVGDIAEVFINGSRVGLRCWAPYVLDVGEACREGSNALEIRVTNSMANARDGLQLPSGLLGPIRLRRGERPQGSYDWQ